MYKYTWLGLIKLKCETFFKFFNKLYKAYLI